MLPATDLMIWGLVAHLVADWLLQNEWMALNKTSLRHPAAWVHGFIHWLWLGCVFGWVWAVPMALIHIFVDLRFALAWWRRTFQQTLEGPMAPHVAIWTDQVVHIFTIALFALFLGA